MRFILLGVVGYFLWRYFQQAKAVDPVAAAIPDIQRDIVLKPSDAGYVNPYNVDVSKGIIISGRVQGGLSSVTILGKKYSIKSYVSGAKVVAGGQVVSVTDGEGYFKFYLPAYADITVSAPGYRTVVVPAAETGSSMAVVLDVEKG